VNIRSFARILLETLASILFFATGTLTIFVPDWLERSIAAHPDAGGGEAEWLIVGALWVIAAILGLDVIGALRRTWWSHAKSAPEGIMGAEDAKRVHNA
jgi:hypothetical protein